MRILPSAPPMKVKVTQAILSSALLPLQSQIVLPPSIPQNHRDILLYVQCINPPSTSLQYPPAIAAHRRAHVTLSVGIDVFGRCEEDKDMDIHDRGAVLSTPGLSSRIRAD